jgi:hypothetical protein
MTSSFRFFSCYLGPNLASRIRIPLRSLAALLLGILLSAGWGAAQQAPAVALWEGVLQNAARAPIGDARIRLNSGSNEAEAVTAKDGRFKMQAVPIGRYKLTILANGRTLEGAQSVDVAMGGAPVTIEISDRGELTLSSVQGQAGTGGEALSSQAVSELPLNKRDFSQLLLLAAGTMTDANGATNFTQQFAINGQRGVEATFAMDGADISDPEMGGSTFSNFNVDAVEGIDLRMASGRNRTRCSGIHQHPYPVRGKRISRLVFRIRAQLGIRCAQLLRPSNARISRTNSAIPEERVWIYQWRTCVFAAPV